MTTLGGQVTQANEAYIQMKNTEDNLIKDHEKVLKALKKADESQKQLEYINTFCNILKTELPNIRRQEKQAYYKAKNARDNLQKAQLQEIKTHKKAQQMEAMIYQIINNARQSYTLANYQVSYEWKLVEELNK